MTTALRILAARLFVILQKLIAREVRMAKIVAELQQQTADLQAAQAATETEIAALRDRVTSSLQAKDAEIVSLKSQLADAQSNPPEAALVDQSIAEFRKVTLDLQGIAPVTP